MRPGQWVLPSRQCWTCVHTLTTAGPCITWLRKGGTWRQGSRRIVEAQGILQTSCSLAGPRQGVGSRCPSFPDLGVEEEGRGGEDRDPGQQARCSNAQSGSDVLFQQTRCLEPGMKVPNGAPPLLPPPPHTLLSLITVSLPGSDIFSFVSYRETQEKRADGGSPCHFPGVLLPR